MSSINLMAENIFVDSLTLTQLFPDCVSEIAGSYDAHKSNISLDINVASLDICVFSKPSVDGPTWSDENPNPSVDEMNPLGKTEVLYLPDVESIMTLISEATVDYEG